MQTKTAVKLTLILTVIPYLLCYGYVDRPVALWFYQHHLWPLVAHICNIIAFIFASPKILLLGVILFVIGLLIYWKTKRKPAAYPWLYIGGTTAGAILCTYVLKVILGRYRPIEWFTNNLYGFHWLSFHYNMTSSPSGHATGAFALFFSLSLWLRRFRGSRFLRWGCIIIAIIIAASRVLLLKHYVGDVILGAGVGIMAALLFKSYLLRSGLAD